MIIDKSGRANVMLVFEGLSVQFYELVRTITWSVESMLSTDDKRGSVCALARLCTGTNRTVKQKKRQKLLCGAKCSHFLYLDL